MLTPVCYICLLFASFRGIGGSVVDKKNCCGAVSIDIIYHGIVVV